jgi:membrane-bound lytic murein transglycosylase D
MQAKWFGLNIGTFINSAKIKLAAFAFIAGGFGVMSFKAGNDSASSYSGKTDSVNVKYGFKSLFGSNTFDASKPYLTQLNPKAVPFVQDYIRKQGKELEKMKTWGRPYFDLYDNILTQYGIPREMKYLSVIESHLRSGLVSWAGAVGPWQLMDYEAKRFGLRVGNGVDDRTDYYKSTHVAARLLKELYAEFGDWLLVVAAYNGGPNRLKRAIQKAGSRDFWDLQYYLPEETRTHVKKFIGTHYIFEGGGGLTTMTAEEIENQKRYNSSDSSRIAPEVLASTISIEVSGRYLAKVVAGSLLMNLEEFNLLNPGFDKMLADGGKYQMRIRKEAAAVFHARKGDILLESVRVLLNES